MTNPDTTPVLAMAPAIDATSVRATVIGLMETATAWDENGMPEVATANRFTARMLAAQHDEIVRLRAITDPIYRAWSTPAGDRETHYKQIQLLRRRWPAIAGAIETLVEKVSYGHKL